MLLQKTKTMNGVTEQRGLSARQKTRTNSTNNLLFITSDLDVDGPCVDHFIVPDQRTRGVQKLKRSRR